MQVLVTGATGFIGRHLIERLMASRENVRALVSPAADAGWLDTLGVEIVRGDVGHASVVKQAAAKCEIIFHLASKTGITGQISRTDVQSAHIQGAENLTRAALESGVKRLVFCSSVAVYGCTGKNRRIDENTKTDPDSPYGEAKMLGEQVVLSARQREGLPVVVARISNVLGPGTTSWLGLFRSIASGQFRLIGKGINHHHLVDVSEVVEGLLLCGATKGIEGRTYILAGSQSVQLRRLVEMISEEVGVTSLPRSVSAIPLHVYRAINNFAVSLIGRQLPRADRIALFLGDRTFDIARAREELGYVPRIPTKNSIHDMAEWFRAEGHLSRLG